MDKKQIHIIFGFFVYSNLICINVGFFAEKNPSRFIRNISEFSFVGICVILFFTIRAIISDKNISNLWLVLVVVAPIIMISIWVIIGVVVTNFRF